MKINLQFKILLAVTLVVIVVLSALAFFVVNSQRNLLYSSQKELGLDVANTLNSKINTREKLGNREQLQSEVDRALELNPRLTEVNLSLPGQDTLKIVGAGKRKLIGREAAPQSLSVFKSGETVTETAVEQGIKVMRIFSPVYVGNQRVGVYHLKFSLEQTEQVISSIRKRFIFGILAVIPEVLMVLFVLLWRTVISPIRKLKEGAEAIESGNLDYRIRLDRRDIIGELGESFNKMAEEVSDFYQNLDRKVEQRTRELEQAKEKLENRLSDLRETNRELKRAKEQLEESQKSLKVKVKARTKKLRELAEKREEIIRRRTKGLRRSRKALMNILEDVEQAKEEVERERDKTAAIVNNLPEGVLFFNGDRELASINPRAREFFDLDRDMTGNEPSQLKGTPLEQLIKVIGEDLEKVHRRELKIKEGLIAEVTTVPMARAQEIGTLVLIHDVTREKRVERMKTEFVSVAAHQLRTPLSGIKWTLKMLLNEELGELNEKQREFMKETYQSNQRMIGLINDLLNVSRIEEGRYVYNPQSTSLENLVREALGDLEKELDEKEIELVFNKPERPTSIKVDVEKLRLAIRNLVDNAVRYSPQGGRVAVTIKQKENEVQFSVEDNGIGIPEEQQDRIFSKFFRASNAARQETEGSGLGLFITKNIIEAHQGEIWFESEAGQGTTFYFVLPNEEQFEQADQ